ncbi:hypothetical protein D9M70_412360 [compost metagenome]
MSYQVQWIVVRRNCDDDSQWFAREPTLTVLRSDIRIEGNDFASVALGFFRRQLQRVHTTQHFLACLLQRLPRFRHDQLSECFLVLLNETRGAFEDLGTLVAWQISRDLGPFLSSFNDSFDVYSGHIRYAAKNRAVERACHRD